MAHTKQPAQKQAQNKRKAHSDEIDASARGPTLKRVRTKMENRTRIESRNIEPRTQGRSIPAEDENEETHLHNETCFPALDHPVAATTAAFTDVSFTSLKATSPEPPVKAKASRTIRLNDPSPTLPPIPAEVCDAYEVMPMSVISSTKIRKKVTQALTLLSSYPAVAPNQNTIVVLHAKAAAASKAISISEITKRQIATDGGKWWSYCQVGSIIEKGKEKGKTNKETRDNKEEDKGKPDTNEDEEEEGFELMKTPFERVIEGLEKIRATPIMAIYLARVPVESLKIYGEQTNGMETSN